MEHFFRREYGHLVAVLSRRAGVQNLEAIEDAVQSALMTAMEKWPLSEVPEEPSAWLFRVAQNNLIGELRQRSSRRRLLEKNTIEEQSATDELPFLDAKNNIYLAGEVPDDLLRMLFVCCDDVIPVESQLVLALKTLCGFGVREISLRLFTTEANVYKRLGRARARLRSIPPQLFDELSVEEYALRRPAVHKILYLLFTEGHLSSHNQLALRRELCDEAIRLATLLAKHPLGDAPESFALVALMHLHAARMNARQNESGGLLLLEEQDRNLWDTDEVRCGLEWLAKSARGDSFSRYHAEAGIAAEHCLSPSVDDTRWEKIVEFYELLEQMTSSPLHRLNKAVAVAEWQGPAAGLDVLKGFEPPTWLTGSYLWAAVLADLHRRCGNKEKAARHRKTALHLAPTPAQKQLLERRLLTTLP